MLPPLTLPSPETIAFMRAVAQDDADYERDIMQARRYNDGEQFVALTERLRMFLGGNATDASQDYKRLRLNVCRIVLSAVVDRLIVSGFDTDEQPREKQTPDGPALIKPVAAWAWET